MALPILPKNQINTWKKELQFTLPQLNQTLSSMDKNKILKHRQKDQEDEGGKKSNTSQVEVCI
jgi:hypothetical protein